ncbi:olfactory receptor 2F2-like [Tachyglossus aculeatus]|uniref:olfactory receptor 2F2-like n=1 Tax=Tachyglossus aculeatus TaxID=9261 RepID=UPI0018F7B22D|nr:olfactory receptor 2F2-like [Tachyglossus aculeatus]
MAEDNHTVVREFILMGFTESLMLKRILFVLFLCINLTTLMGNLRMTGLIGVESQLHTPMYFFLSNVSCVDACCSLTIAPKMLFFFLFLLPFPFSLRLVKVLGSMNFLKVAHPPFSPRKQRVPKFSELKSILYLTSNIKGSISSDVTKLNNVPEFCFSDAKIDIEWENIGQERDNVTSTTQNTSTLINPFGVSGMLFIHHSQRKILSSRKKITNNEVEKKTSRYRHISNTYCIMSSLGGTQGE